MRRRLHLGDVLDRAEVRAPSPHHVELQPMDVGGVQEYGIFQHPDSEIRFGLPPGFPGGAVRIGLGIKTRAWDRMGGAVRFTIAIEPAAGDGALLDATLEPRTNPAHRAWAWHELAVPAGTDRLVLRTEAVGAPDHAWSGWADPVLAWESAEATASAPVARTPRPNLLLITSDACRTDFLACYGDPEARTPNLDALAADGLRFADARANCTTTVGSYASLITGRHPPSHGLVADWGALPRDIATLPGALAAAGYRTVFAPSSVELGIPERGFSHAFDDTIRLLGNPSQDGAVTTRRALEHLGGIGDRPWFAWLCYRETHPPMRMPERQLAEFYQGDPRDPSRAWRPEEVNAIRGSESLLYFEAGLPPLREGHVTGDMHRRLLATADALEDASMPPPDLAVHLRALGPDARRGRSVQRFAKWLRKRVRGFERGEIAPDLVEWVEAMCGHLREAEREGRDWLDGVVDYHYPLAQLRAGAAHLDRQVGELVAHLRAAGEYESTTIVFWSPHGELLGEGNARFHHAEPREPVLRVPLIVKPAGDAGLATGTIVAGPLESIDLGPTLLGLLGVDGLDPQGASRAGELRSGTPLPERPVFAMDGNATRVAVRLTPHKLVRTRAWVILDGEFVPPGTSRLYRTDGGDDLVTEDQATAAELGALVDEWLAAHGLPPTMGLP